MQQWEDWPAGYDWRVLVEKTALTLLAISLSYFAWQLWSSTQREAAIHYRVPIPSQLTHGLTNGPDEDAPRRGPSEEVSSHSQDSDSC